MAHPEEKVPEEHIFHFRDGDKAHNLVDLRNVLEHMEMDEFNHHVDDFNNDFANWVEFVYKDTDLANDMKKVTSQKQTIELLDAEIGKYSGSSDDKKEDSTPVKEKEEKKAKDEPKHGIHEKPITPTHPPQSFKAHDGKIHHTVSTDAVHEFIVKEFLIGAVAGLLVGVILMGVLILSGVF